MIPPKLNENFVPKNHGQGPTVPIDAGSSVRPKNLFLNMVSNNSSTLVFAAVFQGMNMYDNISHNQGLMHRVNHNNAAQPQIAPDKKNIGLLERFGLKKINVENVDVNGQQLEVTHHPRTGERSVSVITGGPQEVVGFTTPPQKCTENWTDNSLDIINEHVKKLLPQDKPTMSLEQFNTATEGKYLDKNVPAAPAKNLLDGIDTGKGSFSTIQEGREQPLKDLASERNHINNLARTNNVDLGANKSQLDGMKAKNRDLGKRKWTKEERKDLENQKNELLENQKKLNDQKRELDKRRTAIANQEKDASEMWKQPEDKAPKNKVPPKVETPPATPPKNKTINAAKERGRQEFNNQLDAAGSTAAGAAGSALAIGGIQAVAILQAKGLDGAQEAGIALAQASLNVGIDTAKSVAISVAWEAGRGALESTIPQISESIPGIGTVMQVYDVVDIVRHADGLGDATGKLVVKANDAVVLTGCAKLGATVAVYAAPAGPIVAVGAGALATTGSFIAYKMGVTKANSIFMGHFKESVARQKSQGE